MPLCVTGMHRSGTSVITHALACCGVYLGAEEDLVPGDEWNADGYWENRRLVRVSDSLLAELGGGWDLPPSPSESKRRKVYARFVPTARTALDSLAIRERWGWKDPRATLLTDFWSSITEELRFVVCVRNPLEVGLSLQRRGLMSPFLGMSLWATYYERLLETTNASDRIVVDYNAFSSDPFACLGSLVAKLEIEVSEQQLRDASAVVDPGQRHHAVAPSFGDFIPAAVTKLYARLLAESAGIPNAPESGAGSHFLLPPQVVPRKGGALLELSDLYQQLFTVKQDRDRWREHAASAKEEHESLYTRLEATEASATASEARRETAEREAEEARGMADQLEARLQKELEQLAVERDDWTSGVSEYEQDRDRWRERATNAERERASLEHQLEAALNAAEATGAQLAGLKRETEEARHALAADLETRDRALEAQQAEVHRLREEISQLNRLIAASASEAATHRAEAAALYAERDHLAQEAERAAADVERLSDEVSATQRLLAAAEAEVARARVELDATSSEVSRLRTAVEDAHFQTAVIEADSNAEREKLLADLEAGRLNIERLEGDTASANAALSALEAQTASDREVLLQELEQARADVERLTARVHATESKAAAERGRLLADLEAASDTAGRLAKHLDDKSLEAEELAANGDDARASLRSAHAEIELVRDELEVRNSEAATERAELRATRTRADELAAHTFELEAALDAHVALLRAVQSVTTRRTSRLRSLSHLATWLLPPTRTKLTYFKRYLRLRRSGEFDVDSYLLANPDVLAAGVDPLMHYVQYGRREVRAVDGSVDELRRSHEFDADSYLLANPDVRAAGIDPFLHYVRYGSAEGRSITEERSETEESVTAQVPPPAIDGESENAPPPTEVEPPAPEEQDDQEILRASGLFDERFYLEQNPDVGDAALDPIFHYVVRGHAEGRDPSASFATTYYRVKYLDGNPAVNPLIHYILAGRQAGNYVVPGPHDALDDVHGLIRASVRPGPAFEEPDPNLVSGALPQVKALAFYLPQFHPIAENDEWWGRGFTDWRNVARGTPRFEGHYQPRIPRDLGFYDLGQHDVMSKQVDLARDAGLQGFVFYYYWFDGKRLLEKPLERFLLDRSLDFPLCLMWANENWTRRWDGHEDELLIAQAYDQEQEVALIDDLQRHFADPRYVRVQDRPLLLLYRLDTIPDLQRSVERWRRVWKARHGEEPLILGAQAFGNSSDPRSHGLDGAFEFPPHKLLAEVELLNPHLKLFDPSFHGQVVSYEAVVDASLGAPRPDFPLVKTAVPSWDNDPRREGQGMVLHGSTPALYEHWLRGLTDIATAHPLNGEPLVFINAWNEWAEGAYLEPDLHYGSAYLNATARALRPKHTRTDSRKLLIVGHDAHPFGAQKLAWHVGNLISHQFGYEVAYLLLGDGEMVAEYERLGTVCVAGADEAVIAPYLAQLRDAGYSIALTNTAATTSTIPQLTGAGFRVVSLVHELGGIIGEYGLEDAMREGFQKTDRVVVAAELVAEGLIQRGVAERERIVIRPQGLYQPPEGTRSARADLRRRLRIPEQSRIVLNVGSGDLRKGMDTFVHVAQLAAQAAPDLHFVWVGKVHEPTARWLKMDLASNTTAHMHFVPHTEEIGEFFAAADVFFLSSREDPYPSVVLEALHSGLPVIGFRDASGVESLLSSHGHVVDRGDLRRLLQVLQDAAAEDDCEARETRRRVIESEFQFDEYCFALARLLDPDLIKISVVVPNFNYAEYLADRLESIFAQTYPVFEIIVLDDGSTDRSPRVIDEVLARTGRVVTVVARDENSGSVFGQWEAGLRLARGEYVWIAEADDLSKPEFLSRLAACGARIENLAFAFCDSMPIDADGGALGHSYKPYYGEIVGALMDQDFVMDGATFVRECLSERNLVLNASSVLWHRECLLNTLGEGEARKYRMAGDWYLYAATAASGRKVAYVAEPLNMHRRHAAAVTASLNGEEHVAEVERVHAFVADIVGANGEMRERMEAYADRLRGEFGLLGMLGEQEAGDAGHEKGNTDAE